MEERLAAGQNGRVKRGGDSAGIGIGIAEVVNRRKIASSWIRHWNQNGSYCKKGHWNLHRHWRNSRSKTKKKKKKKEKQSRFPLSLPVRSNYLFGPFFSCFKFILIYKHFFNNKNKINIVTMILGLKFEKGNS